MDFIQIGLVFLAYHAVVQFEISPTSDSLRWQSRDLKLCGMVVLHDFPLGYEEYIANAQAQSGNANLYVRKPASELSTDRDAPKD